MLVRIYLGSYLLDLLLVRRDLVVRPARFLDVLERLLVQVKVQTHLHEVDELGVPGRSDACHILSEQVLYFPKFLIAEMDLKHLADLVQILHLHPV